MQREWHNLSSVLKITEAVANGELLFLADKINSSSVCKFKEAGARLHDEVEV